MDHDLKRKSDDIGQRSWRTGVLHTVSTAPLVQRGAATGGEALLRLPALLLGLQGLLLLAWALDPNPAHWPAVMAIVSPIFWGLPGRWFNLFLGGVLLVLAGGLRRRKRYAWLASLLICAAAALTHLLGRDPFLPTGLSFFLIACLLLGVGRFTVQSGRAAVQKGLRVWGVLLAAVLLTGGLSVLLPGYGPTALEPAASLTRILTMFSLFYDPEPPQLHLGGAAYTALATGIYLLSAAAWVFLLMMFDQPMPAPLPASVHERRRARQIVQAHGRTSQAHLTLLDDKCYFFTPAGSMVAYAVTGRVAITLADPIGPAEDAEAAIRAFSEHCAQNDWLPAFCLTSSEYLELYRQAGFEVMCMGHEGIIPLKSFSLKGNQSKTIRKRYNRLLAQGYRVEIVDAPIADAILVELRQISDEWLNMAMAAEKRFFLACFDEDYVRYERIAMVRTPDGRISAFTNLVPEYQLNEISIDLMRRRKDIESGTMDFLFVALFLWARDQGYDTFNLGLSPLFGVGEHPSRPLLERGIHYMYHHGNFYDFKGLNGFKIKFRPVWSPQYMVYPGILSLGWVGLAMARVNAGENESLWSYFASRPKQIAHADPEELPLVQDGLVE